MNNRFMATDKYCNFTPVVVFSYSQLGEFLEKYEGLQEDLESLRDYMAKATNYRWGSTHFRFSNIFGEEFAFQIYGTDFTFWDHTGHTCLGHVDLSQSAEKAVNEIHEVSKKFSNGQMIRCSDCGEWMSYQENDRHRYFAGVYCLTCWDDKWKAIEAKENYE